MRFVAMLILLYRIGTSVLVGAACVVLSGIASVILMRKLWLDTFMLHL